VSGIGHYDSFFSVAIVVARSECLTNLVSLDLSHNKIDEYSVEEFAQSATLTNLTHLDLSHNYVYGEHDTQWEEDDGHELFAPLLLQPSFTTQKLQVLNLDNTGTTFKTFQGALEHSPCLTELSLRGNRLIGSRGATFIATSPHRLTKLDLLGCNSAYGYDALIGSASLSNLRELHLHGKHADAKTLIALVNSPLLANLTRLEIFQAPFGRELITAIAQSPSMSKLQHLKLKFNQAGDEGVIALAKSTTLVNLTSLDLTSNGIGPEGIKALCTSPVVSKLTRLTLNRNNCMDNSVVAALAAPTSTLYNILELNLAQTRLDDQGVQQLLKASNLDQLDVLNVGGNATSEETWKLHRARFDRGI
jgi:Ran GTPase-activating protein (RanGAP) involved in mRNA processing and transport